MSNGHTSKSAQNEPSQLQITEYIPAFTGQVLLLRRRHNCEICGRIHGPPLERCRSAHDKVTSAVRKNSGSGDADMELAWTF